MLRRACTTLVSGLALAAALGSLLLGIGANTVAANGPHVESREIYKGPAGPYELRVLTAPVVGTLHLSIAVFDDEGLPVSEVPSIDVTGLGPRGDSQTSGPVSGVEVFASPGWYAADLPVESTGEWTLSVTLDGAAGAWRGGFPRRGAVGQRDQLVRHRRVCDRSRPFRTNGTVVAAEARSTGASRTRRRSVAADVSPIATEKSV